ncbi:MAG: PqqD family protein [Lachnospiraceae bacterium]|nr:PqqD family protein [Lachnospiraceae bacterium]
MAKKKAAVSANYLDFVPVHNPEYEYKIDEEGRVTILQENKGLFNKIAQMFFKKPRISNIHLDEMGNFLWPLMDGKRSIMDLSVLVKEEFGEKAEPLYNRLVQYVKTLEAYGFISVEKTPTSIGGEH